MKSFILKLIILTAISTPAAAQQTIFNVPSDAITPKNKNFFQHESQFRSKNQGRFWNGTHYYARGIGHNTELDATLFNTSSPTSKNATLGLGFKSTIPLKIKNISNYKPQIIIGMMAAPSLQSKGLGHWFYGAGHITIEKTNTKLLAGISSGTKQIFGKNTTSFMAGFEQKITGKINYIGDWYAGNSSMGIFATGLSYAMPKDLTLYGGYQISNSKKVARNSFVIEVAKIF